MACSARSMAALSAAVRVPSEVAATKVVSLDVPGTGTGRPAGGPARSVRWRGGTRSCWIFSTLVREGRAGDQDHGGDDPSGDDQPAESYGEPSEGGEQAGLLRGSTAGLQRPAVGGRTRGGDRTGPCGRMCRSTVHRRPRVGRRWAPVPPAYARRLRPVPGRSARTGRLLRGFSCGSRAGGGAWAPPSPASAAG